MICLTCRQTQSGNSGKIFPLSCIDNFVTKVQHQLLFGHAADENVKSQGPVHIYYYYIVINIFLLISMENNRAIYPCICTLIKNTDKMYIALVQI